MTSHHRHSSSTERFLALSVVAALALTPGISGCATDDHEGHTKTVKKTTTETPTEKTTTTETREKTTEINPR